MNLSSKNILNEVFGYPEFRGQQQAIIEAALRELGIEAEFSNSSRSLDKRRGVMAKLRQGKLQLLYVAPERLATQQTRSMLRDIPISLIAIDEAHCVSQRAIL